VGGATYKALILPAAKLIPLETLVQIQKLAEQGATVIFAEQYPSDVPGLSNLEERRAKFTSVMKSFPVIDSFDKVFVNVLGKGKIITGNDYGKILSECQVNKEVFVSELGGQLIRRKNATGYHYFFTMLKNKPIDGWVTLGVDAESAMFFDPMTGQKGKAALRKQNGRAEVYMQLEPGESIILKTFTNAKITTDNWAYYQPAGNQTELKDGWEMNFVESEPAIDETFKLQTLGSWTELDMTNLKRIWGLPDTQ
jgi:hypothetical protein